MFNKRQKVGTATGLLLSLVFGFLLLLTGTVDLFMAQRLTTDQPLQFSVRVPTIGTYHDTMTGGSSYRVAGLRKGRGEKLDPQTLRLIQTYEAKRRPPSTGLLLGLGIGLVLLLFLYSMFLRREGGESAYVRTQLVLFGCLLFLAIGSKVFLVTTAWSPLWIPLAMVVIPVTLLVGHRVGAGTAIVGAAVASLLTPLDLPLLAVLLGQGLTAAVAARSGKTSKGRVITAALAAAVGSLLCYAAVTLMLQQYVPLGLPTGPFELSRLLQSDLVGSAIAPLLAGLLAIGLVPAIEWMLGQVSKGRLIALADFENPLLKRLSTEAPGTWAHCLNMANMAEMAANAIGANALLVRVGAYYHDLGKMVQPEYFIENQEGDNPHDQLGPEVSADAIFAHVTEGAKLCRKHKLPQAVVEFVYTHHGNSMLEYFWHKAMKAGNPEESAESDFRYPGIRPQSRETGILALCDSVEAASKSIKDPDMDQIRRLVRQIVFTKLEQGMLDEADLTLQDLHKVIESLVETLRSSMHVRVKYPWQEEEDKKKQEEASEKAAKDAAKAAGSGAAEAAATPAAAAPAQPPAGPPPVAAGPPPAAAPGPGAGVPQPVLPERQRVATRPLGIREPGANEPDAQS